MALSSSIQEAQAITLCQFCEESPEIKYKCVHCDILLCQLCNSTLHKKKTYSSHKVINLKDHGTTEADTIRKVDLKNMHCDVHTGQKCCVYCSDCDEPICPECLTKTHNNHKFTDLKEGYNKVTSEMVALKETVEDDLKFFQKVDKQLKSTISQGEQTFQATKTKVLQQEAKLKEAATKQAKELLNELELQWWPTSESLKKEIQIMEKYTENLESRKMYLEKALNSHQARDIFTTGKSMDKNLPTKSETNIQTVQTVFIPAKDNHVREKCFGNLFQVPNLEVVQPYQTEFQIVGRIFILDETTAYIGSFISNTLLQISFKKDNIKILSEVKDIQVYDMAITNNRDVLISTKSNEIKLYQKGGQIKTFNSFSPLYTLGLYATEQNEILVGLTNSKMTITPKPDSIRKVVSLTTTGDIKHTYEYEQNNQRLFTQPQRITANNSLIFIVDILNENLEGRVVTIDKGAQLLLWAYTGCNTKANQKFYPTDIQFTQTGLVLITDCKNHALNVLNTDGETIGCISVKELGIEFPFSLSIDKNGFLFIGCIAINDKDKKARIHKLKFT